MIENVKKGEKLAFFTSSKTVLENFFPKIGKYNFFEFLMSAKTGACSHFRFEHFLFGKKNKKQQDFKGKRGMSTSDMIFRKSSQNYEEDLGNCTLWNDSSLVSLFYSCCILVDVLVMPLCLVTLVTWTGSSYLYFCWLSNLDFANRTERDQRHTLNISLLYTNGNNVMTELSVNTDGAEL